MIADYLGLTVPLDRQDEITSHVADTVTFLGGHSDLDGLLRLGSGGTVKLYRTPRVFVISVSGAALAVMRSYGYLSQFLWPFSEGPHKITRLHIAHDILEDSPKHLRRVLRKGRSGSVLLTPNSRRPVLPKHATYIQRHCHYDPSKVTGTVYLGSDQAENRLAVYDKRNERIDRGFDDPGHPWTRFEVRITDKSRVTLRDVVEPDGAFWHVCQCVLAPPPEFKEWNGMAEHFSLERPPEVLPYELMRRRIENSPDVDHLLSLADRMGPEGYTALLRLLDRKRSSAANQQGVLDRTG